MNKEGTEEYVVLKVTIWNMVIVVPVINNPLMNNSRTEEEHNGQNREIIDTTFKGVCD